MGLPFYGTGPFSFTSFSVFSCYVLHIQCFNLNMIPEGFFLWFFLLGVLWVPISRYFFLRFGDFLLWFQISFDTPFASDSYPPFYGVPNFLHVVNSITQLCALWAKYWLMWQDRCMRTNVAPIPWKQPMSS